MGRVTRILLFILSIATPAFAQRLPGNVVPENQRTEVRRLADGADRRAARLKTNWSMIVKSLGEFQGIPSIAASLGGFCSAERAREVRAFFEKNPIPSSQRAVQQAIERIENCVALRERQASRWRHGSRHCPQAEGSSLTCPQG